MTSILQGAAALAKGIYDPTLPVRASLRPIEDVDVARAYHTLSVVKGRAYIFGGTVQESGNKAELADDAMHVVILPSSGVESSDYKKVEAQQQSPSSRWGHSASVIDDRIYIFGGSNLEGEAMDEQGRVWIYDTSTDKWSHMDPPSNGQRPEARISHASVASEHPQAAQHRTDEGVAPQFPIDPAKIVPEPPAPDSYGTVIIHGGRTKPNNGVANDLWAFDISSRTWAELPEPPPPHTEGPSLAMVNRRIYAFSKGQTSFLDLTRSSYNDRGGQGELGLAPLGPWSSLLPTSSSPDATYPGDRSGASLIPVTSGQGRNYLLLVGGQSGAGEVKEDIWVLQLKPEGMTAASVKDAVRQAISKETKEAQWEEVKYCDAEGVLIQEGQTGRGIEARKGVAVAKGTEIDGASVIAWGGISTHGHTRGDGVMITIDGDGMGLF